MIKKIWPILILLVLVTKSNAAEIGDVLYDTPDNTWGANEQYEFGPYCGHAAMFLGMDDKNCEYLLHAPGNGKGVEIIKIVDTPYGLNCRYYKVSDSSGIVVSKENRRDMIKFGVTKIDCPYTMPNKRYFVDLRIPNIQQQKGYEVFQNTADGEPVETYTCVGFVERMYEEAGINLTRDGPGDNYGRDLVRE